MNGLLSPMVHARSPAEMSPGDSIRLSVGHLLARAYSFPCSTAAQAFTHLVQPTARFQLALDALLPLLDSNSSAELTSNTFPRAASSNPLLQLSQRILAAYILFSLYSPHPISVNPFKSALLIAFGKERERAVVAAQAEGVSPNEQLVWVLWKILKGEGNDIGPYSPTTLARSPLPSKLRALNLALDKEVYNCISDLDDATYIYFQKQNINSQSPSDANQRLPPHATVPPTVKEPISNEEAVHTERVVHAMKLLMAARERVLTLSEQRVISPYIHDIASLRFITTMDLTHIVTHNPMIAHPLFVGFVTRQNPEDNNLQPFLQILPVLAPTLGTLDLFGQLLRDQSSVTVPGYYSVSELVRTEVLGRFISESIKWIDRAEHDEREGLRSDDRSVKAIQNLCRFYTSLIKLKIVDPTLDSDTTEMAHFSLRNARYEEAKTLYQFLALSRS